MSNPSWEDFRKLCIEVLGIKKVKRTEKEVNKYVKKLRNKR